MKFFRWAMQENHQYPEIASYFEKKFIDQYSADLRIHYWDWYRKTKNQEIDPQTKKRASEIITATAPWLAQVYTAAFEEGEQFFRHKVTSFPAITIERISETTRGHYDPNYSVVVIGLVETMEYFDEMLKGEDNALEQLRRKIQLELTIREEVGHFFQHQNPKNRHLFETYGEDWKGLPFDEQVRLHDAHPLEVEAKEFAVRKIVRDLKALSKASSGEENSGKKRIQQASIKMLLERYSESSKKKPSQ